MKVKVLKTGVILGSIQKAGAIVDVPIDRAKQLIAERRVAEIQEPEILPAPADDQAEAWQPVQEDEQAPGGKKGKRH
jgi:hypothetical protein